MSTEGWSRLDRLAQKGLAQSPMEVPDPSRASTTKQRTDEQGTREQGVKHRPSEATYRQEKGRPYQQEADFSEPEQVKLAQPVVAADPAPVLPTSASSPDDWKESSVRRRRSQSGCKRWSSRSHLIFLKKLCGAASMLKLTLTLSLSQVEFARLTAQPAEAPFLLLQTSCS